MKGHENVSVMRKRKKNKRGKLRHRRFVEGGGNNIMEKVKIELEYPLLRQGLKISTYVKPEHTEEALQLLLGIVDKAEAKSKEEYREQIKKILKERKKG